jgi:hypothetical protein
MYITHTDNIITFVCGFTLCFLLSDMSLLAPMKVQNPIPEHQSNMCAGLLLQWVRLIVTSFIVCSQSCTYQYTCGITFRCLAS